MTPEILERIIAAEKQQYQQAIDRHVSERASLSAWGQIIEAHEAELKRLKRGQPFPDHNRPALERITRPRTIGDKLDRRANQGAR